MKIPGVGNFQASVFYASLLIAYSLMLTACYAEGIDLGPCKLYPTIRVDEEFQDNLYLVANNEKSDFITTVTPGLLCEFKTSGDKKFSIDYKYEILKYKKQSKNDTENSKIKALFELYGKSYFLKLKDDFQKISQAPSSEEFVGIYYRNIAEVIVGRDYNDVSLEFGYQNLNYDYTIIDSANNRNEHKFDITGYYKFLPKTSALVEYSFKKIYYDSITTKDGRANEFLTGVTGELSQKMTGTVKIGYQLREYESRRSWKEPVTYTNIVYDISGKSSLSLTVRREPVESTYTAENFYEKNNVSCRLSQELTGKTTAYFDASYEYDKYPLLATSSQRRRDNILGAKVSIDTKTRRWLNLGASYEFKRRDSSEPAYDYKNNITAVYLKALY